MGNNLPTDVYQTLDQLNKIFQQMLLDMLGYVKTGSPADYDPTAFYFVRVSWPTEGAPAWKITEDIVFIRVVEEDHAINREREVENTRVDDLLLNEKTSYTRVVSLAMVFYGPNSFEHAQTVRDGVFDDRYRLPLAKEKIFPIPDIVAPRRIPEAFQAQYWERTDLELRFNEKISKNRDISTIGSAEIVVYDHSGEIADITVTEN